MIVNAKTLVLLGLLPLGATLGCATWHENLMSNEQLVAANCQQLATEQRRVADNAKHSSEASSGGMIGAVFLAVLEGVAAAGTNTPVNANSSASMNSANLSAEHKKQVAVLQDRANMIDLIRSKKGCA